MTFEPNMSDIGPVNDAYFDPSRYTAIATSNVDGQHFANNTASITVGNVKVTVPHGVMLANNSHDHTRLLEMITDLNDYITYLQRTP